MASIGQIGAVVAISALLGIGGSAIALSQVDVPEPGEVAVQTVGVPEVVVDDPQDMLSPADEERLRADAQRLDAPSTVRSLHWMVFNESRDNVNDTVEEFMRENYPDQIGDDKYADGFLAIAAFPDQRQVGSYAGEDVADQLYLREGQRLEAVNDAIKPGMRDNNIPAALFAGARTALDAGVIEEYAVQSAKDDKFGAALAGGLGAGGVGVAGGSLALVATNRRKKAIEKGRQDHELITREYAELGARLDEVDIRANSLTSAFADAELRKQWAQVRDRFLNLHEKVSGAGGIGSIDMRNGKAIYDNRAKLAEAAEAVRHTSNAEKNINRLFAIENGDAAARRSDLTDIREDVMQARLGVKNPKLEGELADLEARINDLDRHPTDPDFLDTFVRVLGDYRTLLEVIRREEFSDVKERKALVRPALYDNNFYYSGYVPYVALSSWHDSNVQAEQAAQSSSATNTSYSSGFSGAGGSSGY